MIRIVEADGDVVELLAKTAEGEVVAIAEMTREGADLILNGVHLDGPGRVPSDWEGSGGSRRSWGGVWGRGG